MVYERNKREDMLLKNDIILDFAVNTVLLLSKPNQLSDFKMAIGTSLDSVDRKVRCLGLQYQNRASEGSHPNSCHQ